MKRKKFEGKRGEKSIKRKLTVTRSTYLVNVLKTEKLRFPRLAATALFPSIQ